MRNSNISRTITSSTMLRRQRHVLRRVRIGRGTVHKYLVEMEKAVDAFLSGQEDHDGTGRRCTPLLSRRQSWEIYHAALPTIAEEHIEEYVSPFRSLCSGSGEFYILRARVYL